MSVRVFPKETYREPFTAILFWSHENKYTSRYTFGCAKTTRSDQPIISCQFECFRRKRIKNFLLQHFFNHKGTNTLLDTLLASPKPLEVTIQPYHVSLSISKGNVSRTFYENLLETKHKTHFSIHFWLRQNHSKWPTNNIMFVRVFPDEMYREPSTATLFWSQETKYTSRYTFGCAKTTRSDNSALSCQFECFRRKRIENLFMKTLFHDADKKHFSIQFWLRQNHSKWPYDHSILFKTFKKCWCMSSV